MDNKELRIEEKTLIECKSRKEANDVLLIAHELGLKWANGMSFCSFQFYHDKADATLYDIVKGCFFSGHEKGYYIKNSGYKVISYNEFIDIYLDIHTSINRLDEVQKLRIEVDDLKKAVVMLHKEIRDVRSSSSTAAW